MTNNSTLADTTPGQEQEPVVEQGPPWLAELFVDPPGWLPPLLIASIVVVGLVVFVLVVRIVRDLDETERLELGREYAELLLIVGSIAVATSLLVDHANLAYWMDVFGGSTLGFAFAQAVIRSAPKWVDGEQVLNAVQEANQHDSEKNP